MIETFNLCLSSRTCDGQSNSSIQSIECLNPGIIRTAIISPKVLLVPIYFFQGVPHSLCLIHHQHCLHALICNFCWIIPIPVTRHHNYRKYTDGWFPIPLSLHAAPTGSSAPWAAASDPKNKTNKQFVLVSSLSQNDQKPQNHTHLFQEMSSGHRTQGHSHVLFQSKNIDVLSRHYPRTFADMSWTQHSHVQFFPSKFSKTSSILCQQICQQKITSTTNEARPLTRFSF
jgi:hypothetical protein